MKKLTAILMDPDAYFREGIIAIQHCLKDTFEVTGVTDSLKELRKLLLDNRNNQVDMIITAPHGTGEGIDELLKFIREHSLCWPRVTWILYSQGLEYFLPGLPPEFRLPLLVNKSIRPAEFSELILLRLTVGHKAFMLENKQTQFGPFYHLTRMELTVLYGLLRGERAKDLGQRLNRSAKTISTVKKNVLLKIGDACNRNLHLHENSHQMLSTLRKMRVPLRNTERYSRKKTYDKDDYMTYSDFELQVKECTTQERLEFLHRMVNQKIPANDRKPFIDLLNKVEGRLLEDSVRNMEYL
ncbi:TPA: hypothetical protein ACOEME_004744 [Enterobacter cloacae subsp. dissolvens]